MTNPYESPSIEPNLGEVPDADKFRRYKVSGDVLYCRKDTDLTEFCFLTGEQASQSDEPLRVPRLPPRIFFVPMAVLLLTLGLLGGDVTDLQLVIFISFSAVVFVAIALRGSVKLELGISKTGGRKRLVRVLTASLLIVLIFFVSIYAFFEANRLPWFRNSNPLAYFLGVGSILFALFYPKPYARLRGENVFEIHNLSPRLLASLKKRDVV